MANGKKQYAVFGLGNFGRSLALTLQKSGCEVIAVDAQMARGEAIKNDVSMAMRAKMEDESLINSLEVKDLDGVIIATADNMEASIMATLLAKEEGVPFVLARAKDALQEAVLKKVGADAVIRSEQEMGRQVAHHLVAGDFPLEE
ncbi:MAG: NAD-binding protein [Lachnospiraceae bacterium]|nr:NAD-binding protein [Lachnospiraceae bacterium]